MTFTVTEIDLLIEALTARASRLEAYGRSNPRSAGPNDRKASAMRALRKKLVEMKSQQIAQRAWLQNFVRQSVDVKGG